MDLIEVLNLQQPDVLGWSLGGFITLTLAVNYPELINKIVLVDTSSGGLGKLLCTQLLVSIWLLAGQAFVLLLDGMNLSKNYPELINKIVLVDTSSGGLGKLVHIQVDQFWGPIVL